MARGTDFGGVHSSRDLHLIQQAVDVKPATPKINLIDVPGADGSVDLTERPAGRITYNDRTITWTYALYPGDDWHRKHRQVSNALNGRRCKITLDGDPDYYYEGRLSVSDYATDSVLRQITVEAVCAPYMMRRVETVIEEALATDAFIQISLPNEKKPVAPSVTVTTDTVLRWRGVNLNVPAGTITSLDLILDEGENLLEARAQTEPGSITISYREGSL